MNIILANTVDKEMFDKYIVLELDTIHVTQIDQSSKSWALLSSENIALTEINQIEQFRDLHNNLIKNYRLRNWKYCEDAIEHLVGAWNGELKSFYLDLHRRIQDFKTQDLGDDWNYCLVKD